MKMVITTKITLYPFFHSFNHSNVRSALSSRCYTKKLEIKMLLLIKLPLPLPLPLLLPGLLPLLPSLLLIIMETPDLRNKEPIRQPNQQMSCFDGRRKTLEGANSRLPAQTFRRS